MNKNCGIYKITSPRGRVYIGQSKNIKRRWGIYRTPKGTNSQKLLSKSFKKYGWENHQFDIIEYCSEDELNCSERFWQDQFDVLNGGLNCVLQDCGEKRKVYTDEFRKRISEKMLGDKNPNWGRKCTKEEIEKRVKSRGCMKGEKAPNYGKIQSEEQKQKSSKTRLEKGIGRRGESASAKLTLCLETGIFYDCAKDASEALNINYGYFQSMLNPNSKDRNKTSFIYV